MDVVDIEDLDKTEVPVFCRFCDFEGVMVIRTFEIEGYVQTFSEMKPCCDKAREAMMGGANVEPIPPN